MGAVLAAIPSPPTGVYHVGPLTLHMYGVMLLLAIAAAMWLTGERWVAFGGEWDLVYRVTIWGVIAGIIGARIYHDITSWNQDSAIHDHWYGPFAVWQGGLGVWGGIGLGVRRRRVGRQALRRQRPALHGRGRAGAPARAGDRPLGQLVEPGALRQAHDAAVGARDPRQGGREPLPPDLPLRVHLGPRRRVPAALDRPALHDPAAGALRALRHATTRSAACSRSCCAPTRRATSSGCG